MPLGWGRATGADPAQRHTGRVAAATAAGEAGNDRDRARADADATTG